MMMIVMVVTNDRTDKGTKRMEVKKIGDKFFVSIFLKVLFCISYLCFDDCPSIFKGSAN